MKDGQPLPCCNINKKSKLIVYKQYRAKASGFYICCQPTYPNINCKFVKAKCCPFCAKDLERFDVLQ